MTLLLHYLLLFHEFGIRDVIHDTFTKDWSSQDRIYLFSIDIFELSVQDELVAFGPKVDRDFPTKKDESENITILESTVSMYDVAALSSNLLLAFA